MRMRGFTQDDSHIFCTPEQVADEIALAARLRARRAARLRLRRLLGRAVDRDPTRSRSAPTRSGTRPPRRCAPPLEREGLDLRDRRGRRRVLRPEDRRGGRATPSAARGSCRRSSSTSTMPERFELEYVGADNERHRPIMIHRALFGSIERFFGVLRRALRRRLPDVAGAGAGAGAARCATTTTPTRRRLADRLQAEGFRADVGRRRRDSSATASARPSSRRCRTCSWSATTTSSTAPSA